jgi:hypothetical protein
MAFGHITRTRRDDTETGSWYEVEARLYSAPFRRSEQRSMIRESFQLIRTVEIEVALPGDTMLLRLETFRSNGSRTLFRTRLWRLEFYRIQPTFPQRTGKPAHRPSDEVLLKECESIHLSFAEPRRATSALAVERAALAEIEDWARSVSSPKGRKSPRAKR